MRAGGTCSLQQGLSSEAAGVVKQAVVLAKRRGHAQVTPLHVASTMLSAPSGLFRAACLESHSHPLQCKALELCFNVALNRLPASSSNPSNSSISNALVAAFKRAQAHQRRDTQQPPPLLAVRIELDQLVVSILDDPSVSRVMREAGFSSTQVKTNVEKSLSLDLFCKNKSKETIATNNPTQIRSEDSELVIESLLTTKKRKSLVLVGESMPNLEATVRDLMDKIEQGNVPEALTEVKFVTIPSFYYFCNLRREEVDHKVQELRCLVKSLVGKGVVLYVGDLKWISEYRDSSERQRSCYCSVEHMVTEIGRLVWGIGETERLWVVGTATFQTYMRCRKGYPSLESVWGLHPVTVPANTLGFSLLSESDEKGEDRAENERCGDGEVQLSCCSNCAENFEDEVRSLLGPTFSSLPTWLKDESRRLKNNDDQDDALKELRKKWNTYCSSVHNYLGGTLTPCSSTPPSSSTSLDHPDPDPTRFGLTLFEPTWKHNWPPSPTNVGENGELRNTSSSDPSSTPNSGSSSDIMDMDYTQKFKEFNTENLNILCNALEEKVPWQREIIPEIAGTILQCRSGMVRRKHSASDAKEETWLLFLGPDEAQAKERISRELAKVVFGSYSKFISIGSSSFLSPDSSDEYCRNKRARDEHSCKSYTNRFAAAVQEDPHRVFFMEDVEQADHRSLIGIQRAIERGRIGGENGGDVGFGDAIIVLSCENFRSRSSPESPAGEEEGGGGLLDLNISIGDDVDSVDDLGILENVDRRVLFKSRDL